MKPKWINWQDLKNNKTLFTGEFGVITTTRYDWIAYGNVSVYVGDIDNDLDEHYIYQQLEA